MPRNPAAVVRKRPGRERHGSVARVIRPAAIEWILPPAVRAGDKVAVCAPAGPVDRARLGRGLALLAPHLRLDVPEPVFARTGYLAGDDRARADAFAAQLADPDVRAILVARGGYGITRMLPYVDPALLARDPKPIVGFSDATALLAWAASVRVRAIHGPVVAQLGDLPPEDTAALVAAITDPTPPRAPIALAPIGTPAPLAGVLVPANLKLLAHQVGTPWAIDAGDAVLLLEEVAEKPYAIDRDLQQLHLAGLLGGLRGVILGDLVRCTDPPSVAGGPPDDPAPARAAVAAHLAARGVPGWWDAPVGHGRRNRAVPFGARVEVDEAGMLSIREAAVS